MNRRRKSVRLAKRLRSIALSCLALAALPAVAFAEQSPPSVRGAQQSAAERDGARDFDFEFGTWTTRLSRLQNPLSGSTTWVQYEGTSIVRPLLDGRANIVELSVQGPAGRIEGMSLRLYSPQTRKWSLNYANIRNGELTPPVIGEFNDGRGEFFAPDTLNGRPILVRFIISNISADSWRFEQAFSADDGKTWEVNWIAIDTRVRE
jgi:hypothetical protein